MDIKEYLEEQLKKADLEIFHYENAIKYDEERLSYFTNIKQYLESTIKNIKEVRNNVKDFLESNSKTLIQVGEDLYDKYKVDEKMTIEQFNEQVK